jgi:hypothetical protein
MRHYGYRRQLHHSRLPVIVAEASASLAISIIVSRSTGR